MQFRAMPKYAPKGLPDIICLIKGHFIGIEVKGTQLYKSWVRISPDQKDFKEKTEKNEGIYLLVDSLEKVKPIIECLL